MRIDSTEACQHGGTAPDSAPNTVPAAEVDRAGTLDVLVTAVAQGDTRAFEELYDRMAPAVLGLVRTVVRDHPESDGVAEEVAREVFVELWRTAARSCPDQGRVSTWVITIAHRRVVDRVRSARGRDERIATASNPADRPPRDR